MQKAKKVYVVGKSLSSRKIWISREILPNVSFLLMSHNKAFETKLGFSNITNLKK